MTQAAGEIGAPARQLSEHVRRLEQEVGYKLLIQATSGAPQRLTPAGERLVSAVRAVSAEEVTRLVRRKRRKDPETADGPTAQSGAS
ncbi:LysR family transcriptional regulator [Embleya sp. MST-111070]|uniref:LysR family transcriptional regulator n=1 Tax=Embleya sp. MST-111070 TaxID=3398231 RepID=UPI003F73797D